MHTVFCFSDGANFQKLSDSRIFERSKNMKFSGNTPMVEIVYTYESAEKSIFAKLEYYNPTGSIKDRFAEYALEKATERGVLGEGQPIVEVTSGNTGISMAAIGGRTGHQVHIFMPEWASTERRSLMEMYGAKVYLVSREEGGFAGAFVKAEQLAKEIGGYLPKQFENPDNAWAHYYGTGTEILRNLPNVTDFVAGIGTGGTIMGVGRILKEKRQAKITAVEPDSLQLLTTGKILRPHKIEGIGDDFIPPLVDRSLLDEVLDINDDDAAAMAAMLAAKLGLGVGISSGANFLGAVLENTAPDRVVSTVFTDDNKKYLSTSLAKPPVITENMLCSKITLLDVRRIS